MQALDMEILSLSYLSKDFTQYTGYPYPTSFIKENAFCPWNQFYIFAAVE